MILWLNFDKSHIFTVLFYDSMVDLGQITHVHRFSPKTPWGCEFVGRQYLGAPWYVGSPFGVRQGSNILNQQIRSLSGLDMS